MDDGEFFVLSDLYEWKNTCFPYKDYSTFDLREMTDSECLSEFRFANVIAVFHIKFISRISKIHDLPYLYTYNYIYHLRVRSLGLHSCCHS